MYGSAVLWKFKPNESAHTLDQIPQSSRCRDEDIRAPFYNPLLLEGAQTAHHATHADPRWCFTLFDHLGDIVILAISLVLLLCRRLDEFADFLKMLDDL